MVAHDIGGAFVTYLKAKRIAVSRDMRMSSPPICRRLHRRRPPPGLRRRRLRHDGDRHDVLRGRPRRPRRRRADHRVAQPQAVQRHQDGADGRARRSAATKASARSATWWSARDAAGGAARMGTLTQANVLDDYVEQVMGFVDPSLIKPFNVVLDTANGMGGLVAPRLFDRAPLPDDAAGVRDRRHVPQLRGQPAHRGEPPGDHRAGAGREGRHRHRLGRRRRPRLLHRRHRRVRRRRLRHRAARGGVPDQAAGPGHRLRRARQLCGQGHGGALQRPGAT